MIENPVYGLVQVPAFPNTMQFKYTCQRKRRSMIVTGLPKLLNIKKEWWRAPCAPPLVWDWALGRGSQWEARPCDARAGTSVTTACTARAPRVGLTPVC